MTSNQHVYRHHQCKASISQTTALMINTDQISSRHRSRVPSRSTFPKTQLFTFQLDSSRKLCDSTNRGICKLSLLPSGPYPNSEQVFFIRGQGAAFPCARSPPCGISGSTVLTIAITIFLVIDLLVQLVTFEDYHFRRAHDKLLDGVVFSPPKLSWLYQALSSSLRSHCLLYGGIQAKIRNNKMSGPEPE